MWKGFFLFVLIVPYLHAQEIKNVNFVQEGELSKLVIEGDKDVIAERFHVTEDKQIILDLKNVTVSPKLLRGIDTSEFPGSVVYISGYKKPGSANDVRFAIQLRDNVRSVLDNNEGKVVLKIENRFGVFSKGKAKAEVADVKKFGQDEDNISLNVPKSTSVEDILANLTLSGPKKYIGKRISINVRDIPVPDLLNMIADTSGFNIIIDQEITKASPLTLTLTNVPWDQALDTIMNLSKLVAEKNANILIMKTNAQATAENEEKIKAKALRAGLEPLVTRVFLINYAVLVDISKIVSDYVTPNRGTIQVDERTNSLIVKDTVDSIDRIKKVIETLDTQTPQILIEAKIIEAVETYSKRLGLQRGIGFGYDPITQTLPAPSGPGFSFSTAPDIGNPTAVGMTVGIFKRLVGLDFKLQMMESESKGRVITSPRIIAQNKKEAQIVSTETTPFRVVTGNLTGNGVGTVTFQDKDARLGLRVKPQVSNDGSISMDIVVEKATFGSRPIADGPPNIQRREVKTSVLVDNGSTVVIGGLYQTTTQESAAGIPFMKDLPLVGWLFRSPYNPESSKNELVIFMTPRIINQDEAGLVERRATNTGTTNTGL